MNEHEYYDDLWEEKVIKGRTLFNEKRDWFHKYILDKVLNPWANSRIEVASKLLIGGKKILDLGIWGGELLNNSIVKDKFSERHGLDLPQESVSRANKLGINAQVWNLNNIPYPYAPGTFDAVTALAVIEHIYDPIGIMKEINRLLRIGGQIIVALPNIVSFSNRVRVLFGNPPVTSLDPGWDGGHLHNFTIPATKKLFKDTGFSVSTIAVTGSGQRLRMIYPNILAGEFLLCGEKTSSLTI